MGVDDAIANMAVIEALFDQQRAVSGSHPPHNRPTLPNVNATAPCALHERFHFSKVVRLKSPLIECLRHPAAVANRAPSRHRCRPATVINRAATRSPAPTRSTMSAMSYFLLCSNDDRLASTAAHALRSALPLSRSVIA